MKRARLPIWVNLKILAVCQTLKVINCHDPELYSTSEMDYMDVFPVQPYKVS